VSVERDVNEVDVVFVGAGPASLAGAIHLARLAREHDAKLPAGASPLGELAIVVLEKSEQVGYHGFSGAVMDPRGLKKLFPDFQAAGVPLESEVTGDEVWFLTGRRKFKLPITPPPMVNHGNHVVSLQKLTAWLATKAEEEGVMIAPGFPAAELLYGDAGQVIGVRGTDMGLDHHGQPGPAFVPGNDFLAKVTVLGEGTRGTLTKQLIAKKQLDAGKNPQVWTVGVKELWKVKPEQHKKGHVVHTMGFPNGNSVFGGGFIYHLDDGLVCVGQVSGLDYADPLFDPHLQLQKLKTHPAVRRLLEGGEMVRYGAKTIPEGGFFAIPKLTTDGALLVGDSGGLLNPMRLKGIHLAIESGIAAAEAIFQALKAGDTSDAKLSAYEGAVMNGPIGQELRLARNFHQAFDGGLYSAMFLHIPLQMATKGRGWKARYPGHAGHTKMRKLKEAHPAGAPKGHGFKFDGVLTFSKVDDVYRAGNQHREDQPAHLKISDLDLCNTKCKEEYGNPCQHFCPANVYEMVDLKGAGQTELKLNPSNCVHCKTCDIMDPYQVITWVAPEGGSGPVYLGM
jgi:electron-transferring-flavoprotein dehydrogenase